MESILFLIIFLVFKALTSQLFESQKTQNHPKPKNPIKPKKIIRPSDQNERPVIIPIEELETVKTEPDVQSISIEQKRLQKRSSKTQVLESKLDQSETLGDIPELFTQDNILRGIILQEILSPPKSLMRRWR